MTTPTPPPPPDGYGAMPPAPDLRPGPQQPGPAPAFGAGWPPPPGQNPNENQNKHNPWPLVIGLGVLAGVLVIGAIATAGVLLLRGEDDPVTGPGPVTVTATPSTPSSSSPSDPGAGTGLAADIFEGDWDFRLGEVSMSAAYEASKDYAECGPIASANLERMGCEYAAMGIHNAEGGKLRMLRIVYVFGSESEATAAAAAAQETDFDLPAGSLIEDDVIGKWVTKESSKAVVAGFVTAQRGVTEERVDDFLHYGTADIAGALAFMDL